MAYTRSPQITYNVNGTPVQKSIELSADGVFGYDGDVADETTDLSVSGTILFAGLVYLLISSDQDITIETNDGSSADDTLIIKANKPLLWYADCGLANPLTANIDSLFITNASGASANVHIEALYDATP